MVNLLYVNVSMKNITNVQQILLLAQNVKVFLQKVRYVIILENVLKEISKKINVLWFWEEKFLRDYIHQQIIF